MTGNYPSCHYFENVCYALKIVNGNIDKLLPPSGNTKTIIIKKGEHFMIVDRANEISSIINNYI